MRLMEHFKKNSTRYQSVLIAIIILSAIINMAVTYVNTAAKFGIGINSDSIAYIRAAENLLQGNGLGRVSGLGSFKPMTHWPPLYSMLLAAGHGLGSDLYASARVIGLVLNILLVALIGVLLYRVTNSTILTISGLSLWVNALPFWETTFRIMSEPLFLVLVLAGILTMERYYSKGKVIWLIFSASWMAFAFLTRYTAFVFVAVTVIMLLTNRHAILTTRIKSTLLFGLISCIPIGIWIGVNQWRTGSATNRVFQYFPISGADISLLWTNLSAWFAPIQTTLNIGGGKILVFCILIGIFVFFKRLNLPAASSRITEQNRLACFFLLLIPIYSGFIVVSRFFFDSMIQIYRERILFPVFLAIFLLVFYAIGRLLLLSRSKSIWLNAVLILVLAFCWVSFFQGYKMQSSLFLSQAKNDGIGFAGVRFNPPSMIREYLKLSPADIKLSNNIELFYLLTGQDALTLSDDFTQADIDRLNKYLADKSAVYVVFNSRKIEKHLVELNPDVLLLYQDAAGGIYRYH